MIKTTLVFEMHIFCTKYQPFLNLSRTKVRHFCGLYSNLHSDRAQVIKSGFPVDNNRPFALLFSLSSIKILFFSKCLSIKDIFNKLSRFSDIFQLKVKNNASGWPNIFIQSGADHVFTSNIKRVQKL